MSYKNNLNQLRDVNLCEAGIFAPVYPEKLDEDTLNRLSADGFDTENYHIEMSSADIEKYDIPYEAINWQSSFYDPDTARETLQSLLKPAKEYLVFAYGCRWNGASGYTICSSVLDTVRRDYDCHITPLLVSKGGKILMCRESSHDVPTGSSTYIIALTEREANEIECMDFSEVRAFTTKKRALLAA